jgi:hypothetical protein
MPASTSWALRSSPSDHPRPASPAVTCPPPSARHHLPATICPPPSARHHLPPAIHPPPSPACHLPTATCPPPTATCPPPRALSRSLVLTIDHRGAEDELWCGCRSTVINRSRSPWGGGCAVVRTTCCGAAAAPPRSTLKITMERNVLWCGCRSTVINRSRSPWSGGCAVVRLSLHHQVACLDARAHQPPALDQHNFGEVGPTTAPVGPLSPKLC